jgi:4-hydroxy-tetrahydrodipicolinate synthase
MSDDKHCSPEPHRLRGIFTPNIVPLDHEGRINEPELRRYVDWLIQGGVHGLYPNGSTGEFTRFTAEERRRIVEIMVDQTRGRVPILAGAAEANTRETIQACEYYHQLNVRAVAIVSPFYYKLGPEGVYAYFREIALHSPVDVTLYNIPMFASPIDVATVTQLAEECPRIVGIKDSSGDISQMMRMIAAVRPRRPDFSFLTGWDPTLMAMLLIGCDGGTNASSGIVPELTRQIYDLTISGHLDQARALQFRLLPLFDALVFTVDFPEGFRVALKLRGFQAGRGRQPKAVEQSAKLGQLTDQLQHMLSDQQLRASGAHAGTNSSADHERVTRIVQAVLADLKAGQSS